MLTVDETVMRAPPGRCFRAAADVERWPERLPHYRWVRFQRRDGFGTGLVEMAARRAFGPLPWPVWWASEMHLDPARPAVLYRHVAGVTRGMEVEWSFHDRGDGTTLVRIVHGWERGPSWPLPAPLRRLAARAVIGPVFIHHVASRTLAGIKRHVETHPDDDAHLRADAV
ncbi:MAG TPA: SRPBCC family protein [Longimicrobiaceae bacterium]|nr:SRPBCC family protein [Longimicrobiaceae bacterium]